MEVPGTACEGEEVAVGRGRAGGQGSPAWEPGLSLEVCEQTRTATPSVAHTVGARLRQVSESTLGWPPLPLHPVPAGEVCHQDLMNASRGRSPGAFLGPGTRQGSGSQASDPDAAPLWPAPRSGGRWALGCGAMTPKPQGLVLSSVADGRGCRVWVSVSHCGFKKLPQPKVLQ